jgi:hypothetical protein
VSPNGKGRAPKMCVRMGNRKDGRWRRRDKENRKKHIESQLLGILTPLLHHPFRPGEFLFLPIRQRGTPIIKTLELFAISLLDFRFISTSS